MTLYEECLEALGDHKKVLSYETTEKFHQELASKYPFTSWGRIQWELVKNHKSIEYAEDIDDWLTENNIDDKEIILLWSFGDYPAIKTELDNALKVIDDVTAVGSDTFMYSPYGFVIEFFHDGDVTIGMANNYRTD
ncbi:hypothetical protein [Bacillus haynesii]|uniref:CDI toxin immunity protein n=1 Tax=Bacillus haynesii TaxID=1925021 RepID=UPI002282173A|nr:hypothetical protein [Bacillus haynesii]MCY8573485.1 hypothetical protein [Bacillus haynesii]MCY8577801.1 hypothetical protein [Bacillus haynesii]MCY8581337.1 hypothetical protein [Bacillus haynesii]MCY8595154.1 hypothetical protein [Bacillus haynesii]MCY8612587.1 hypothetical protein [Bacillus haynesii]